MAWVSPVFDRVIDDVLDKTAKGYFNLADYARISGNISEIKSLVETLRSITITLVTISVPGVTTIPGKLFVNSIAGNIETIRQASGLPLAGDLIVLKTDWGESAGADAPDYQTLNEWEQNIQVIYTWIQTSSDYLVYSGVASVGQSRLWQNRFRRV